jgi:hypothetical protein
LARLLRLKAEAALVTDSHVPVVAAYARALIRVYKLSALKGSTTAWDQAIAESTDYQRKKEAGPYPAAQGDKDLLVPSVARGLGIDVEAAVLLERRLDAATTEADLAALSVETPGVGVPEWARLVPTDPTAIIR